MAELLWLLLPIAASAGWFAAARDTKRKVKRISGLSSDYFKGLNFLLNEQPDKAIEVFIRMVEVDNDTAETHLALGHLFRRRGEVDRAIRIHQNLIARPRVDPDIKTLALLELGEDYMKAGLFDRAENLFLELIEMNEHSARALTNLRDIYQQEQDWEKAIAICQRLESITNQSMHMLIAQYHCELAEAAFRENNLRESQDYLLKAMHHDNKCVRASVLQAKIDIACEDYKSAINAYKNVVDQDIEYFPEVLDSMIDCYRKLERKEELIEFLGSILKRYNGISPMLALAELIREKNSDREAMEFMTKQLHKRSSVKGLHWLIELSLKHSHGESKQHLEILYDLTQKLLKDRPVYECHICGFAGRTLHWQCPSCKAWNTVKPIHGLEGE